jgi:general secretion pathway protein N
LSAIWSVKGYLLIGLFSFIIFLAFTAPLEFIWPKVQPHMGRLPVQVDRVSGTLWQGQARINIPKVGKVVGQWDIQLSELFTGKLAAKVNVSGDDLKFKGLVRGNTDQIQVIESEAFMSSRYLAPLLRQGNSSLIGDFELSKFNALFSISNTQIIAADGRLLFSGGDVSFPLDGERINATLPVLMGAINMPADNVELVITNTDGQNIGKGYVQPDGWAGIGIRRRLLDILGIQWSAGVDEDKVIFEASQKLF